MVDSLLEPFPVRLVPDVGGAGRGIVTTRSVRAGELVLVSAAAAVAVHRKHQQLMCARCLAYSEDFDTPAPVCCETCGETYYCTDSCKIMDKSCHDSHCTLLGRVSGAKQLKKEEASLVRLLFRMLSECALTEMAHSPSDAPLAGTRKKSNLAPEGPLAGVAGGRVPTCKAGCTRSFA